MIKVENSLRAIPMIAKSIAFILVLTLLSSCSDIDYSKMMPSRMDIAGATAVGFIEASDKTRADAVSSGLYKIDADGNISAVAVYFTEDEKGNQTKHESKVRLAYADMMNAGNDFICFTHCRFTDKEGEIIGDLPYSILVRKSDGRMWEIPKDVQDLFTVYGWGQHYPGGEESFHQNPNGSLYCGPGRGWDSAKVFKFNLDTEPATVQQVTANSKKITGPVAIDSNGVIFGPVNTDLSLVNYRDHPSPIFIWSYSGFQDYTDISWPEPKNDYSDEMEENEGVIGYYFYDYDLRKNRASNWVINFHGQFYWLASLVKKGWFGDADSSHLEMAVCYKFSIGDTPGSARIDESEKISLKSTVSYRDPFIIKYVKVTPDCILISGMINNGSFITALNPETKEWKWVTETPFLIDFNTYKSTYYNNRDWYCGRKGAYWFNLETLESGYVPYNTSIPDYMEGPRFANGKVTFSGINPADSHRVTIVIDVMTGEAVTDDSTPAYQFTTLISLN